MKQQPLDLGGDWTADKLERIKAYLQAYSIALKNKFQIEYIDAFAGTGSWAPKRKVNHEAGALFPEIADEEWQKVRKGSVQNALEVRPEFDKYVFIEKGVKQFEELERVVSDEFSHLKSKIELVNEDANEWLVERCRDWDQKKQRATLFLDPCGMEVEWTTIKAVARTQSIDMWYLFPLGIGLNRLLKKDGNIRPEWRERLNKILGTSDWYDVFYEVITRETVFGEKETEVKKRATFESLMAYFQQRLESEFAGVARNPLLLYNSTNCPIYLLCFAVGNPSKRASDLALRIAEHILKRNK